MHDAGESVDEAKMGGVEDGGAEVEENGVGAAMVERRVRKWRNKEYVVLFESYQESIVEGMTGWQVRMLDGWVRRGMLSEWRRHQERKW